MSYHGTPFRKFDPIDLLTGIIDALQYIHGQKYVHRDIRSANIVVQDGIATLIDFGYACQIEQSAENFQGSLQYASTRILTDQQVEFSPSDDIESLVKIVVAREFAASPPVEPAALVLQFWNAQLISGISHRLLRLSRQDPVPYAAIRSLFAFTSTNNQGNNNNNFAAIL